MVAAALPLPRPVSRRCTRPAMLAGAVTALAMVVAGCGSSAPPVATPLHAAPEPAVSPAAVADPPGTVVALAGSPEGVAVTAGGVVAVNVHHPDGLVVFPLGSGGAAAARQFLPLTGSARHLTLAGPDGPALVPQEDTDHLVEVALPGGATVASVPVGRQPHEAFAVSPDEVVVANEFGNSGSVIRAGRVVATVPAPLQPGGGASSADGSRFVLVGVRGRRITEYTADGRVVGSANCGAGPTHTVTGDDGLFWVNDTNGDAVLGFRLTASGPQQVATISTGAGSRPYGDAYDAAHHTLWVTLTGRDQLLGLSFSGSRVVRRRVIDTVRQPNTVAVDPTTGEVVVTGSLPDGQLQLLSPALLGAAGG